MKENLWLAMVTCLAHCVDKGLWKAIEYLKEQVKVLMERQEKDKRILLDNHQKIRLAATAKRLMRTLLEETTVLFTPATMRGGTADSLPRSMMATRTARIQDDPRARRRSSIS